MQWAEDESSTAGGAPGLLWCPLVLNSALSPCWFHRDCGWHQTRAAVIPMESRKTMELHPEPRAAAGQGWPWVWAAPRAGIKGVKQEIGEFLFCGNPKEPQ